jgi:hypothetical protein
VLVLNPDLRLREGALAAMLSTFARPDVAAVVPLSVFDEADELDLTLRREPSILGALGDALVARQPNRPPRMALCILLTVAWFTLFVPAIAAFCTVFLVVLATEFVAISGTLWRRLIVAVGATVRTLLLPALPIFVLSLAWLLTSGVLEVGLSYTPHSLAGAFRSVAAMTHATVSYVGAESWFYRYYALVLYVLVLIILAARWKLFQNSSYRV